MPEREQGSMETGQDSGARCAESLASYDLNSRSWKTSQVSLFAASTEYSGTWPRSGTMRNGRLYPQPMSEHRTSASGSGLWPTPRACKAMAATITERASSDPRRFRNLETAVGRAMWATPSAADAVGSTGGGQGRSLRTDIHNWKNEEMLPTPRSRDWKDTGDPAKLAALIDKGHQETLPRVIAKQQVKLWPTPCAQSKGHYSGDIQDWGGSGNPLRDKSLRESRGVNGALNPTWVEWLMGYPLGWTVLKDSETP